MKRVVFDFDGTLALHSGTPNYDDPEVMARVTRSCRVLCLYAAELRARGVDVVVLTARAVALREVTRKSIDDAGLGGVLVVLRPHPWSTWERYVAWKAAMLRELQADLYVGDLTHDREAALRAGVPFIDAAALRALVTITAPQAVLA